MKITIKGQSVTIEGNTGGILRITLDQLLEMMRLLNAATNQDGGLIFDLLEFTV